MSAGDPAAEERLRREVRATLMPGFAGYAAPAWVIDALDPGSERGGLLALCVYGGNVRDRAQLGALGARLHAAAPGAILAIDEEGGEVTRLHYLEGSPYPGAAVLGRIDDLAYTEEIGARVGRDILALGFNLALAPDADVNANPDNPVIGTRSFGADPALAARHVAAWVRGLQGAGAGACPKHFPGHGDTAQDSHLALPTVDASPELLAERDLPPFRAAFEAGAKTVMTSHILLPRVDPYGPATFSAAILRGILRDRLGFAGVVVSDALDMRGASGGIGIPEAAVRALAAGCDLLCLGTDSTPAQLREIEDRVVGAVREGRLDAGRLGDAAARVRGLAAELAACGADGASSGSDRPGRVDPAEIARIAASFAGVEAARAWLRAHPGAGVIRVDSEANMAVGAAPWGPFAPAARTLPETADGALPSPAAEAFAARPQTSVDERAPRDWALDWALVDGAIVIGRELHRRPFARAGIDALREAGAPVLAVELGWPGRAPGYADLACYGSSALVGAALLGLLAENGHPEGGAR